VALLGRIRCKTGANFCQSDTGPGYKIPFSNEKHMGLDVLQRTILGQFALTKNGEKGHSAKY
jgi:hypothetical protein